MKKFFAEFRDFAMKGNVIDLAVGVIIGSAFNAIISSLVKDIIMPLLSMILGRINIADLKFVIPGLLGSADITLTYGLFLQAVINFVIIALSIFITIKVLNRMQRKLSKKSTPAEETAAPTSTEMLLTEIRDLLKESHKGKE
jgi:large conductance mechanosensitive channel